jgi:hypothetical protein
MESIQLRFASGLMLFVCTLIEFHSVGHYCSFCASTREMGGAPINGTSFVAYSAKCLLF